MGSEDTDFDVMNEADWAAFSIVLEVALTDLEVRQFLCVEAEVPATGEPLRGAVPYVQAMRAPQGLQVEMASNECLDRRFRLSKDVRRHVRGLGFSKPRGESLPNYWAQFRIERAGEAAHLLVTALREGYGVQNPAFLHTEHAALAALIRRGDGPARETVTEDEPMVPWLPAPGEDLAAYPRDPSHLRELIAAALLPMVGEVPPADEDGDIGILAGCHSVVFLRPTGNLPHVLIHCPVVIGVADRKAARREVRTLNRVHPGIQYVLIGDAIHVRMLIPAMPFAPTHLRAEVNTMLRLVPGIDTIVAERVRGRTFLGEVGGPAPDPGSDEGGHRRKARGR